MRTEARNTAGRRDEGTQGRRLRLRDEGLETPECLWPLLTVESPSSPARGSDNGPLTRAGSARPAAESRRGASRRAGDGLRPRAGEGPLHTCRGSDHGFHRVPTGGRDNLQPGGATPPPRVGIITLFEAPAGDATALPCRRGQPESITGGTPVPHPAHRTACARPASRCHDIPRRGGWSLGQGGPARRGWADTHRQAVPNPQSTIFNRQSFGVMVWHLS
jgi:hypothetical protein